jgi:transcriptional regulator with XRE-family HTH domain
MNKALLRAEMIKHGDTQETLATAMGISLSRLNAKINSENAEFRQTEIIFIKDRYNLSAADVDSIFFNV